MPGQFWIDLAILNDALVSQEKQGFLIWNAKGRQMTIYTEHLSVPFFGKNYWNKDVMNVTGVKFVRWTVGIKRHTYKHGLGFYLGVANGKLTNENMFNYNYHQSQGIAIFFFLRCLFLIHSL